MRSRYIVCYDICDSKRLRVVHKTMRGFGDAVQYSVFSCDLSPSEKVLLLEALTEVINHREDRVLLIALGPVGGRAVECVESLGQKPQPLFKERLAVIV